MKIKKQTLKELETLSPFELHIIYDLILSLKSKISRNDETYPLKCVDLRSVEGLPGHANLTTTQI